MTDGLTLASNANHVHHFEPKSKMNPSAIAQRPIKRVKPTGPNDPIWEHIKPTVSRVYWDEDCILERTMEVVAVDHNFTATKKQWTDKLNTWNLKKNVSTEEMRNIARIREERWMEHDKETRFLVRGRLVAMENLERWQKRQKLNNGGFVDVPSSADAVTTPSEISYETPSEAESVLSRSGAPTPRELSEDCDTQSNNNHAALALVDLFHARPDDASYLSNLLDTTSISEMFPATSGPISPVINTPRAGSPAASEREATTIQNSRQTPMTMEVDDTFPVSYQTDDVDLVDEQESISRGSRVLDVLHVEMNLSDSESDTSSVIMLQEQDHDEAVDNLRPGLLSLAVTDGRADTALPTVLFPESDPDGPVSMASLEAHSSSKRRPSDMTANAMEPGSAADPVVPVAPCNNEDIDQTDDQPLRQISVKANDPKTETTTPSHYGQRRPLSMKDKTTLIYGVPKNVEIDSIESLSDDASVVEIDRDEMLYSSDSSDSSIESVDAESYKLAIRLSRAATNRALLPSQEMMAQEMKDRALRAAARAGDSRSVQRLIAKGADIHSRSKSGMMALHTAALHGHPQVVGLLLQLGSDVDKTVCGSVEIPYKHSDIRMLKSLRDPDSLRLACSKGHQDVAKLLLSHQPSGINHALICAVFFGVDPIVFMLLYWGNETNHLNAKDKENALHLAALLNYQSTVELLLSGLSSHDNVELAAILVLTIHAQNRQLCELIVKRGPNMKYRDGDGETPLTIAIETGKIDIVKVVLDASGSDLDYHNDNGDTPLTVAVRNNNRDIVKLLLDSGASIDYRSAPGDTALILAVLLERRDMIELLLSRGASVECKSAYGNPALILAVWQGMRDVVELLLSRGASVECRSAHGDTALVLAVREGMTDMVELLLRRGVSMEYTVEHGDTALTYAISRNKAAIVTLLVNNGANVHHRASSGNTPLVLAFQTGNEYLVKLLLDKGATV